MKHSEFIIHRLFLYQGTEYICTDIGTRTIIAVSFKDVREDWWLYSTPYPGAMTESVFDENRLPACQPIERPGSPPPARTPEKPPVQASTPSPGPAPTAHATPALPPLRLLVLATAFCVLGIGSLVYCASSSLHTRAFFARATRAIATVTSVEDSTDTKGHHRYTPTLVFTDAAGKTRTHTSSLTEDAPRRVGEEVPVLYDPQNPVEARIEDFWNTWGTPLTSGLAGLLMLGAGTSVGKHFSKVLRQTDGNAR